MKVTRLAMLHTVAMLVDRFKGLLREAAVEIDTIHLLDESLLRDLMKHGPQPAITRRVASFAGLAADAGADLIVFTCSSTSPAIDTVRPMIAAPILKIDDPMAARAVAAGDRIGVLCTTTSTKGPSGDLLRAHAARQGRKPAIDVVLVPGAFDALSAGKREEHDRLVLDAAGALAQRSDVLVLAQASLAHLQEPLGARVRIPVLASPKLCVDALAAIIRGEGREVLAGLA
jgi:Asp/Glu/hydantoin racemase